MKENEKRLASNTLFLYIMQISGYVFPLITFPYLTRVLGADKYGVVVFSNAVMQYFNVFIDFGFLLSATSTCSQNRDDKGKLSNITLSVMASKLVLSAAAFVVLLILCHAIDTFKASSTYFVLSFIAIVLTVFLPDFLFRGIERMSILTYRVIFSKLVYMLLIFVLVRKPDDYLFVPLATIGGNLVSVILTWFELIKKSYISFVKISIKDIGLTIKEASTFFLSRVAVTAFSTLNTVLLGFKCPSYEVGQYGSANTLTQACKGLMSPVADSVYPYMVKNKNFSLLKKIILILEPLILLACIVLWFLSPWVIRIVCGEGYEGAVDIFRLMLPYVAVGLPNSLMGYPVFGAMGKIKIANTSVIYASFFHLAGLAVLFITGKINVKSVAVLMCITEYILFSIRVVCFFKLRKRSKNSQE